MTAMQRLLILFLAPLTLFAQAEIDTDNRNTNRPLVDQQEQRARDELNQGGRTHQHPDAMFYIPPSQAPRYADDFRVESDTDRNVPDPLLLQQENRVLSEMSEAPSEVAITGEVVAKWNNQYKRTNGHMTRGVNAVVPVTVPGAATATTEGAPMVAPANAYTIAATLWLDYESKCDWAEIKIDFKNDAGVISGTTNRVSLNKAWLGYDLYMDRQNDFYLEAGRKALGDIFDSRIEFDSRMDGILFTYERKMRNLAKFLIHGGPNLVDARTSHFAWIGEAQIEECLNTGAYAKYALAWWQNDSVDRYGIFNAPEFRYVTSQVLIGYDFPRRWLGMPVKAYAAGLINTAAERVIPSGNQKRNTAWYAAIQLGKLQNKAHDIMFDICYQEVGLQAVPQFDLSGIGRGNSTSRGDLPAIADPTDPANFTPNAAVLTLPANVNEGNTNYRGVVARYYYNFTPQLTLKIKAEASAQKVRTVGFGNTYRAIEVQFVYGF